MINKVSKNVNRQKRHLRLRQTLSGTATKPRLNVFRSNKQIYAQIIDDTKGITLLLLEIQKQVLIMVPM